MTAALEPTAHREGVPAPLWVLTGQLAVAIGLFGGFGAHHELPGRLFVLLLFMALAAMVLLGPTRAIERVVVGIPVALYLAWWALSYLWTTNFGGWFQEAQLLLPTALALVVLASVLPTARFVGGLVLACHAIIAWTVIFTVVNPDIAMIQGDGAPGWRGGFIHKNTMAPTMLFAIVTFASFERNRARRWAGIAAALALVIMARSMTTLVVGVLLVGLGWILATIRETPPRLRSSVLITTIVGGTGIASVALLALPSLAGALGRDPTLTGRTQIWEGVLRVLGDRPWVGYGVGGVWVDQAAEHTREIHRGLGFNVFHAHNGLLEVALQLGVIGAVLYLVLLSGFVRHVLGVMRVDPHLATYLGLYAGLIVFISVSEVATFGIWLALLCTLYTTALRSSPFTRVGSAPAASPDPRSPPSTTTRGGSRRPARS